MKFRPYTLLSVALFSLILPACKKSSGGGDGNTTTGSSEYYLNATVNGKAWSANVSNNSLNTPVLAAQTGSGSATLMLVLGIQAVNKDSSAFAIVFPKTITLNKTVVFNPSQYMAGVYAPNATSTYATSKNTSSDDSLTVTSFDQSAKIIEGTFKGTFYLSTGTGTVKVTDGKFRTPYVLDASQLPPSNVKF